MWHDIRRVFHKYDNFLITTHVNPDGDGIGAACALVELLLHKGKRIEAVYDSPVPTKLIFLDYHHVFQYYDPSDDYSHVQVVIVLDAHRLDRIGGVAQIASRPDVVTICIDHHEGEACFADFAAIDPHACSVGAMIYSLCRESGFEINLNAASGIYTSILCDTGRFCYSTTTIKAHKIAEECIRLGVDPDQMYARLFQQLTLAQLQIFARALQGMELYLNNRVLVQVLKLEECQMIGLDALELENIDLEYILEFDKLIGEVQCVALLREVGENKIRVSLRSTADLDLSPVVGALGGGGHSKAAGALVHGSLDAVKAQILQGLEPLLRRSETEISPSQIVQTV